MKIDIDKIVDALEMVSETMQAYYNTDTGEIEWLGEFLFGDEYEEASDRIEFGNYISLPTKYDIHEYRIMEDFVYSLPAGEAQNMLNRAFKGKGAFRRFKDAVIYLGVDKEWYSFRDETYRNIALKWCRQYGLKE